MNNFIKKICEKHYYWIYYYIKDNIDQEVIINDDLNLYKFNNFCLKWFYDNFKNSCKNITILYSIININDNFKLLDAILDYLTDYDNDTMISLIIYILFNKNKIIIKIFKKDKIDKYIILKNFLKKFNSEILKNTIVIFDNITLLEFYEKYFIKIINLDKIYNDILKSNSLNKIEIIKNNLKYLELKFPNLNFSSILHYSVDINDMIFTKFLISINKNLIFSEDNKKMTPIFYAIKNKNYEMIKYLLVNGSDINHWEINKNNPLYSSVYYGNLKIVKLLVEYKCDYNKHNFLLRTPLIKSVFLNQRDIFDYLISLPNINVNFIDNTLRSAIHMSCWGSKGGKKGKKTINDIKEDFLEAFIKMSKISNVIII